MTRSMTSIDKSPVNSLSLCRPEECPLAGDCPIGPVPNMPCEYKAKFLDELNDNMALSFQDISLKPDISIRVNMMLRPLFEQLLRLRLAEFAEPTALFGTKANPLMKEIRQVILAIDKVLQETVRLYHDGPGSPHLRHRKGGQEGLSSMTDKGYYEMLLVDNQGSVEERKGLD